MFVSLLFTRNGPARLRCWFGEWSGGSSTGFGLPKCVGNPCELPEITGGEGKYIGSGGSYRPGIHFTKHRYKKLDSFKIKSFCYNVEHFETVSIVV